MELSHRISRSRRMAGSRVPLYSVKVTLAVAAIIAMLMARTADSISQSSSYSNDIPTSFKCQGPATMVKLQCPQQPRQTMWRRTMGSHHNWLRDEGRVLVHGTRTFLFSTQEEDTGIYEAWTVEKPQRVMCRMYLIIAEGRKCRHRFQLSGPKKQVALAGSRFCLNYTLTVSIEGNAAMQHIRISPSSVTFYHTKITQRSRGSIHSESGQFVGVGTPCLCINNVTTHDSGKYRTFAHISDSLGFVSHITKLKVRQPATLLLQPSLPPVSPSPDRTKSLVNLTCIAEGNPLPSISWYKNGARLVELSRLNSGDTTTLRIEEGVTSEWRVQRRSYMVASTLSLQEPLSAGTYSCRARNIGRYGAEVASRDIVLRLQQRIFATNGQ